MGNRYCFCPKCGKETDATLRGRLIIADLYLVACEHCDTEFMISWSTYLTLDGDLTCLRCGGKEFDEEHGGPDSYKDDIVWKVSICKNCRLWYSGWRHEWLILEDGSNLDSWLDEERAILYSEYVESTT